MNPHASLNEENLIAREILVSSTLGVHLVNDGSIFDRSDWVSRIVLAVDMNRAPVEARNMICVIQPAEAIRGIQLNPAFSAHRRRFVPKFPHFPHWSEPKGQNILAQEEKAE
jgi:hypothetical protein